MYLFGASGHAKVIVEIIELNGGKVKGFFDDDPQKQSLLDIPVLGKTEDFQPSSGECLVSIGDNGIRKKVTQRITTSYFSTLHPGSIISSSVKIGEGTVVMAGAVINIGSIIGRHVIINTASSVDHDCRIGDFVHIAPNVTLCGGISIGEGTLIGSGAVVIPNLTIGKWALVGAGSVVTQDIPDHAVVVGNPGRIVKYNKP